jgi:hypothetical protein
MNNDLFEPVSGISDDEMLRRLRLGGNAGFARLAKLIGDDAKALRALREESKFIRAHPELPGGSKFAEAVRGYLIANKLEWTQENLERAVTAAAAPALALIRATDELLPKI